jgi:outer membrane lipoprotein-sorting protein
MIASRLPWLCLAVACAGRIPLPKHLEVSGLPELVTRMEGRTSPVQRYSAEARLNYFGKEGRVRTRAVLVAARPSSLRYDVMGPHGGVVSAFATDGRELQLLDIGNSRFVYGPATAANITALLNLGEVGLDGVALTRLFFGEVLVPQSATLTYDDRVGRFVINAEGGGEERRVEVDPVSSRPVRGAVLRRGALVSEVMIEERDDQGIPVQLRIRVPAEKLELLIELDDLEHDPALDASVFRLDPPQGVTPEYLSPVAPFGGK